MINILTKNEVIVMHRQGKGIKTIDRETRISKNIVKKYVREYDEQACLLVAAVILKKRYIL